MSKHKAIPKKMRQQLYEKYNHRCAYCGCNLEYKDMQVDHIKSVYLHADYKNDMAVTELYGEDNLLPACRQCNFYKSTMTIDQFRKQLKQVMWENLRKEFSYRLALKYGLIEEYDKDVEFYFEILEKNQNDDFSSGIFSRSAKIISAQEVIQKLEKFADNANDAILTADNPQYYDGYEDGVLKAVEVIKEVFGLN